MSSQSVRGPEALTSAPLEVCLEVDRADGTRGSLRLEAPHLVVAGFTGRDAAVVDRHVRELGAHGVPTPAEIPCYWVLPNWLLAVEPAVIQVASSATSGEVEPVIVRMPDGASYVTVGSDHTDRELERASLALAKLVCPKIMAGIVWPLEDVQNGWDAVRLHSSTGEARYSYQDDCLAAIREPDDILGRIGALGLDLSRPLIAFLGTVPLVESEFVFAQSFSGCLEDTTAGRSLAIQYGVEALGVGRPNSAVAAQL